MYCCYSRGSRYSRPATTLTAAVKHCQCNTICTAVTVEGPATAAQPPLLPQRSSTVSVTQYVLLLQSRVPLQPPQPAAQPLLLPQRSSTLRRFHGEDKDFTERRSCSRDHGGPQPVLSQYEGNLLSDAAYQLGPDSSDPRLCRRHPVLRASVCVVRKHTQCTTHLH
jgi:hypothetical protein